MKTLIYMLLVAAVGALTPLQASINARLGTLLKNPFYATLTNFLVGLAVLAVLLLMLRPGLPPVRQLAAVPPYLYLGGVIGVTLVTTLIVMIPKIGATNALMALVVGQMLISILIDHNGWLGVPVNSISPARATGAVLLLAGLYLVQRSG